MIELILQALFLPTALSTVLLLLPRLPWCVDVGRRVGAWTAAPALGAAAILSLYAVEGSEIWLLTQRWYSLWVSALILAVGGVFAWMDSSDESSTHETSQTKNNFLPLACTAALAIFFLKMPNYDGMLTRLVLAAGTGIASILLIRPSRRAPIVMPLAICIALGSLAVLLLVSGSMKVALVASSLSLTSGVCAMLSFFGRGFSGGASFAMAGISLVIALGLYGASYHDGPVVPTLSWCVVSSAPLLLCAADRFRSRSSMAIALAAILVVCATVAVAGLRAAERSNQANENSTPYTCADGDCAFPRYSSVAI